jgi:hypothetical protein
MQNFFEIYYGEYVHYYSGDMVYSKERGVIQPYLQKK